MARGSRGPFRDGDVLVLFISGAPILLLLTGLLRPSRLGGGEGSGAASPAGDGGQHEAERHEEAHADAHHEVKGEGLRVGCVIRATTSTTEGSTCTPSLWQRQVNTDRQRKGKLRRKNQQLTGEEFW